jgi:hypothetical protein
MTYVRRVAALASGFVIYMVVVYLVGFLAAIAIPKAYFEFFGRQHATLALTLLDAATLALPSFMLSLAWFWVTLRWIARPPRVAVWWCLGGIAIAWLYWQVDFVLWYQSHRTEDMFPLATMLFNTLIPPIWGISTVLAVPAGLVIATWMASTSVQVAKRHLRT